ncbi:MAG: PDZ domain-containing protein [Planctomycetota bacterium]|nr:PDZ domain-containing protein [Planctomycetota bacterium]
MAQTDTYANKRGSQVSGSLLILACGIFLGSLFYSKQSSSQETPKPAVSLEDVNRAYLEASKDARAAVTMIDVRQTRIIFGQKDEWKLSLSGTVWDEDGHIVTVARGLKAGSQIFVKPVDTLGGTLKEVEATWIGSDEETGLALLKAKLKGRVKVLSHRQKNSLPALQPGSLIVTAGNPCGFQSLVRVGNIAGLNRTMRLGESTLKNAMLITAPVNPGDPGGVVVDSKGQMIGIMLSSVRNRGSRGNRMLDSFGSTPAQSVSFAIPVETVNEAVTRILAQKKEKKVWLGVEVRDLSIFSARDKKRLGLENQEGIIVFAIAVGSPAEKAGLSSGDLIKTWNGKAINKVAELAQAVRGSKPGNVKVTIIRRGKSQELSVEMK